MKKRFLAGFIVITQWVAPGLASPRSEPNSALHSLEPIENAGLEESLTQALSGGLEEPSGKKAGSFEELLWEILDKEKAGNRSSQDSKRLLNRFVEFFEEDERSGSSVPETVEARARGILLRQSPGLTVAKLRQAADNPTKKLSLRNLPGMKGEVALPSVWIWREQVTKTARILEGLKVTQDKGPISESPALESTLAPPEYLACLRAALFHQNREGQYLSVPTYEVVGFSGPEEYRRVGEETPYAVLPLLAVRQTGLQPSLRAFDLAVGIVDNGLRKVEVRESNAGQPPFFLLHFARPLIDASSGRSLDRLAVFMLKTPWPELPKVEGDKRLEALSDEEFLDAALQSLLAEREQIEQDAGRLRQITFQEGEPISIQAEKRESLLRSALEERLVPRSGYQPYTAGGAVRLARWMGRTVKERQFIQQHMELSIEGVNLIEASGVAPWSRPPKTERAVEMVWEKFQRWKRHAQVLEGLGFLELAEILEAGERVEQIIKKLLHAKKGFPLDPWRPYYPLLRLVFARDSEGEWALRGEEATYLLNRMEKFHRDWLSVAPILDETLASMGTEELQAILSSELNQALLSQLIQKQLKTPLVTLQKVLLKECERLFHVSLSRSPTALALLRNEQEALLKEVRQVQDKFWASLPGNLSEAERVLTELERLDERLRTLGPGLAGGEVGVASEEGVVPPLQLSQEGILVFLSRMEKKIKAPVNSKRLEDPYRLGLYRSVLDIARLVPEGRVRKAFERSRTLGVLLEEWEQPLFHSFRQKLAEGIAQEVVEDAETSPAEEREAAEQRILEAAKLVEEFPQIAEKLLTTDQTKARALLSTFARELSERENRLLREFVEAKAEWEPFPEAKKGKLRSRYRSLHSGSGIPMLYKQVALELDPSLLPYKPISFGSVPPTVVRKEDSTAGLEEKKGGAILDMERQRRIREATQALDKALLPIGNPVVFFSKVGAALKAVREASFYLGLNLYLEFEGLGSELKIAERHSDQNESAQRMRLSLSQFRGRWERSLAQGGVSSGRERKPASEKRVDGGVTPQQRLLPKRPSKRQRITKELSRLPDERKRLKYLRRLAGFQSPHELEKAAGVAWATVSRVESGKRGIGLYVRRKVKGLLEKRLGLRLTFHFHLVRFPLEGSVNVLPTTEDRLTFLKDELLGWAKQELAQRANTVRSLSSPALDTRYRHAPMDQAHFWIRRSIRDALERGLSKEFRTPVRLDGRLRIVTNSVAGRLRALPNAEARLTWLLEEELVWYRSEFLREAEFKEHREVRPPPNQQPQALERWRRLREALEKGLAARGERLSLDVDLLPQKGSGPPTSGRHAGQAGLEEDKQQRRDLGQKLRRLIQRAAQLAFERKYHAALAAIDQAYRMDPRNSYVLVGKANLLIRFGKLEEALDLAKRALEIDPHHQAAHTNRAKAYFYLSQREEQEATRRRIHYEEAERAYPIALEIDPANLRTILVAVHIIHGRPPWHSDFNRRFEDAWKIAQPVLERVKENGLPQEINECHLVAKLLHDLAMYSSSGWLADRVLEREPDWRPAGKLKEELQRDFKKTEVPEKIREEDRRFLEVLKKRQIPRAGLEERRVRVIADDATGGAELVLELTKIGKRVLLVSLDTPDKLLRRYRFIVYNTLARNLSSRETRRRTGQVKGSILQPGEWAYVKIDSTLRGHWLDGIIVWTRRLRPEVILVAPAIVSQGRATRQGVQELFEGGRWIPLHETVYRNLIDPGLVETQSNLEEYLRQRVSGKVELLNLEVIEQGPEEVRKRLASVDQGTYLVADVTESRHLETLAQAVKELRRPILCSGSAGLYGALVKEEESVELRPWVEQLIKKASWGRGKVLVLAGSRHERSDEQVRRAVETLPGRVALLKVSTKGFQRRETRAAGIRRAQLKIREAWQQAQSVILQFESPRLKKRSHRTQHAMAEFYRELIGTREIQGQLGLLVVFGGDTLGTVLKGFEAGFTATGEVAPQISYGKLITMDRPSLPLISKAGGFGDPDLLVDILTQARAIAPPRLGVTMGDPAGSGPELLLRALIQEPTFLEKAELLVIGDAKVLTRARDYFRILGAPQIRAIARVEEARFVPGVLNVLDLENVDQEILVRSSGPVGPDRLDKKTSRHFGRAALTYIDVGIELASAGQVDGLVTLPVTKEDIDLVSPGFRGHTDHLAQGLGTLTGSGVVTIALIYEKLRVLHVTTHLSLKKAVEEFQKPGITDRILKLIRIADQMGRGYFGFSLEKRPRIGVLGLNPHVGEGGLMGTEDQKRIQPAIDQALPEGLNVVPHPIPADTAFTSNVRDQYDFLIAMYHDQGHGPFKAVAGFEGVNVTGNLPIVRTSPDHGTARQEAWNLDRDRFLTPRGVIASIRSAIKMIHAARRSTPSPIQASPAGLEEIQVSQESAGLKGHGYVPTKAKTGLEETAEEKAKRVKRLLEEASYLASAERFEEAFQKVGETLQLDSGNAAIVAQSASLLDRIGYQNRDFEKVHKALEAAERVLEKLPNNPGALTVKARILFHLSKLGKKEQRLKRHIEAEKTLWRVIEENFPDHRATLTLVHVMHGRSPGDARFARKDVDALRVALRILERGEPRRMKYREWFAQLLFDLGDLEWADHVASKMFRQGHEGSPSFRRLVENIRDRREKFGDMKRMLHAALERLSERDRGVFYRARDRSLEFAAGLEEASEEFLQVAKGLSSEIEVKRLFDIKLRDDGTVEELGPAVKIEMFSLSPEGADKELWDRFQLGLHYTKVFPLARDENSVLLLAPVAGKFFRFFSNRDVQSMAPDFHVGRTPSWKKEGYRLLDAIGKGEGIAHFRWVLRPREAGARYRGVVEMALVKDQKSILASVMAENWLVSYRSTTGLEEILGELPGPVAEALGENAQAPVTWVVVPDTQRIPQSVVAMRIPVGKQEAPDRSARPVVLAQAGLLPQGIVDQFRMWNWNVELLPSDLTRERLMEEVDAGLKEWEGPLLVVVSGDLEEAVKRLPAYGRVTAVALDPGLAHLLSPNVLLSYLTQTLTNLPGRFLRLESVVQAGLEQTVATATQL